jgi:hypothetical protein
MQVKYANLGLHPPPHNPRLSTPLHPTPPPLPSSRKSCLPTRPAHLIGPGYDIAVLGGVCSPNVGGDGIRDLTVLQVGVGQLGPGFRLVNLKAGEGGCGVWCVWGGSQLEERWGPLASLFYGAH